MGAEGGSGTERAATRGAPKPSAKTSTTAMPVATGRPTSGGTSSPPPHPSSILLTTTLLVVSSIIFITIAALRRKRKRRWLRGEGNVVFAKRKGRRKENIISRLSSQHYTRRRVWLERRFCQQFLLSIAAKDPQQVFANLTKTCFQPDVLGCII